MAFETSFRGDTTVRFAWNEVTGAIGDSVTVLPFVVAVGVLTDLSLPLLLVWFGVFQIVWGLAYGVPVSVEPMKALAALVLAGTLSVGEFLLAGLLVGGVLLLLGVTDTLARASRYIGDPVVRGVQFGVALVLLETGVRTGLADLPLAGLAVGIALLLALLGYRKGTALAVLAVGGVVAGLTTGLATPALPTAEGLLLVTRADLTLPTVEATGAQLAMSVGNAALAASVLLADYYDRPVSADELATSMGLMNLVAVPLGGLPMCHGSGGIAGKYAFGARTAGANVLLGVGYIAVALFAVGVLAAYPVAMLGVVLVLIGLQLGRTSLTETGALPLVVAIGVLGLLVNLGVAFAVGVVAHLFLQRRAGATTPT